MGAALAMTPESPLERSSPAGDQKKASQTSAPARKLIAESSKSLVVVDEAFVMFQPPETSKWKGIARLPFGVLNKIVAAHSMVPVTQTGSIASAE